MSALDTQIGGSHYRDMAIQPIEVMRSVLTDAEYIGYLKGNIIKYSMRAGKKAGSDDAGKAQHYREFLAEALGRKTPEPFPELLTLPVRKMDEVKFAVYGVEP